MRARWLAVLGAAVGLALAGGAISPAVAAGPGERAVAAKPLSTVFDNVAISDDADPAAADIDGAGHSFSAQDLSAAGWTPGRRITIQRTALTWPDVPVGQPDNVVADGQTISLPGRGDALTFLAASTHGDTNATGEIVYTDGTRRPYTLAVPDWVTGTSATKAVALPHANSHQGQLSWGVRVYARTVPLDPGRTVESVVLPRAEGPELHVFAVSRRPSDRALTGSWAASTSGYTPAGPWDDQTLRLVVHSSADGPLARVRLDNTFAGQPVTIAHATVAVQGEGAAPEGAPVPLTFRGAEGTTIPAGGQAFTDPADFDVPAGANLLVSLHLPDPVSATPAHTATIQTSYLTPAGSGDHSADTSPGAFTGTLGSWPFLTGIDVTGGPGSVIALGDSITDGVGSTHDANRRWPDRLASRLRAQSDVPRYGVLNHGISANQIARDRYNGDGVSNDSGGVSARHRLERDVLSQTGARSVIVFEGINDVNAGTPAADIIAGLRDIAERSHAHGLRVLAATIAPCGGWRDCTPEADARREEVNAFIRDSGDGEVFDAVLDFDAVLRDPAVPSRMLPEYDSGDHLHPGDAGLAAVAESVDLALLVPRSATDPASASATARRGAA